MRTVHVGALLLSAWVGAGCGAALQQTEPTPSPETELAAPPAVGPTAAPAAVPPPAPPRVTPTPRTEAPRGPDRSVRGRPEPTREPSGAPRVVAPATGPSPGVPAPGAGETGAAEPPPADTLSADEHARQAISFLDRGEPEGARTELETALRHEPDNERARMLLQQLDGDPEEALGRESFPYEVQPGDSLSKISKRFLGDEYKFYILARYNDIAKPNGLEVGQVLRIPGKKPKPAPTPREREPVREPAKEKVEKPAPKPVAPPKAAEGDPAAEKLYQGGVQALNAGSVERAYDLFLQTLRANPRHAQAQERLRSLKPTVVDSYYKKAVAALRRHDLDETIRYCDKALEIDPDSEKVKLRRAEALELQERLKKVR